MKQRLSPDGFHYSDYAPRNSTEIQAQRRMYFLKSQWKSLSRIHLTRIAPHADEERESVHATSKCSTHVHIHAGMQPIDHNGNKTGRMLGNSENPRDDPANASGQEDHAAGSINACVTVPDEILAPLMNKSTKAISLVLMGSALALAGCSSETNEEDENRVENGGGRGVYGGSRIIAPRFGGGVRAGGSVSASPSVRGGFAESAGSAVGPD